LSRLNIEGRKVNCFASLFVILCFTVGFFSCLTVKPCYATGKLAVAVIFSSNNEAYAQAWNGFHSYFDEHNVSLVVTTYTIEDQGPEVICSDIRARNPVLVFTIGTRASKLAKEQIKDIPVIFCMVFDPHEFVGTNSTGVSMGIPVETRLEGIRRVLPRARKIAVIYSAETAEIYREVEQKGSQVGLTVIGRRIDSQREFPGALKEMAHSMDCFLMVPDSQLYSPVSVKNLLLESLREGFPVVGLSSHYTKAGALFSFDCDYGDLGRQAAEFASRIARGERPAAIPPSSPRKIRLSINRVAADRLGTTLSSEIVREASEVFGK